MLTFNEGSPQFAIRFCTKHFNRSHNRCFLQRQLTSDFIHKNRKSSQECTYNIFMLFHHMVAIAQLLPINIVNITRDACLGNENLSSLASICYLSYRGWEVLRYFFYSWIEERMLPNNLIFRFHVWEFLFKPTNKS